MSKTRKRIAGTFLTVILMTGLIGVPKAEALTVFDPTNYSANSQTLLQQIQSVAYQYQQIQYSLQNLAAMDPAAAAANLGQVQQALTQLVALQQQARGIVLDYQNFQQQWDSKYKEFGDFHGMTGADYAAHAYSVLQSTNDVIYDAMRAQGLVAQIGADTANLQSLMSASQSAQGALAAAQAGNQIAVLNTQQMMRLQQIMAASNQAQTAYYAEIKQREAMAQSAADQWYKEPQEAVKGQGPGIIH
jgi:P-type conjugative transfer protein TrbJ